jgi:hypothetical protein
MEQSGELSQLSPLELDELWEAAKVDTKDFPKNRNNHG